MDAINCIVNFFYLKNLKVSMGNNVIVIAQLS